MNFKKPLAELTWKRRRGQDVAARMRTLRGMGQTQAVVINPDGLVLDIVGQTTCQAAKLLGWTEVEVYLKGETVIPCG